MRIPCGRGSALLRRRSATLYNSGFMDGVAFVRNGREGRPGLAALSAGDRARPGRTLMSMHACYLRSYESA